MIGAIRNSLLQGLFRKYYGVQCKHPSVYSKDIVETRDGLIQGYLRCLLCASDTLQMSLSRHQQHDHICRLTTLSDRMRRGSFLDVFWSLFSFYIIHLLSAPDKITALTICSNYLGCRGEPVMGSGPAGHEPIMAITELLIDNKGSRSCNKSGFLQIKALCKGRRVIEN